MKTSRLLGLCLSLACIGSQAQAVIVTGVDLANSTGLGTVWQLGAFDPLTDIATPNEGDVNGATSGNFVNLSVDILQKHVPFRIALSVDSNGSTDQTEYMLNLTVRNQLTSGSPASVINGFDAGNATASTNNLTIGFPTAPPTPTSNFTVEPGYITGSGVRIGGLNGGGTGQILFGASSLTSIPFGVGSFNASETGWVGFEVVANPEPGTLALGALALVPAGIVVSRRRRQKKDQVAA